MAMQIETNRHAALLAQRTSAGEPAPELEPLAATLMAALEQALLAAQCLLRALDGAGRCHANAAMHQTQVLRLLTALGPCGVGGQSACCCADNATGAIHSPPSDPAASVGLTRREGEVLRLLAEGQSNQRIAHLLCLSPRTVQRHVANLYLKVGAHNRAEATVYALRHDLT